jgi:hypothetical protein
MNFDFHDDDDDNDNDDDDTDNTTVDSTVFNDEEGNF